MNLRFLLASLLALALLAGCERARHHVREVPKEHLTMDPKETANLSEREYLMRKATIGSRAERLEALDVIDRANDPETFQFLLDRLTKEDDRFLQIRIMRALANTGDVRAVPLLRGYARWDQTRVGVERSEEHTSELQSHA
jgi:HEAT repeat protein